MGNLFLLFDNFRFTQDSMECFAGMHLVLCWETGCFNFCKAYVYVAVWPRRVYLCQLYPGYNRE
ncbi:hypothetical protein Syun_023698 [Stephania yunnanensis]|uniref:Uncharacterized protein n=1 Tax=Stephania yunnanensis TaxID=152371 RepID=A0AAP0FJA7_9MAGN